MAKTTFGVIVGNRGFFPDVLAKEGRKAILSTLRANGYGAVALPTTETKYGAVETFEEARKCAALFASKADKIDGIIVTLPNFGDERGIAEAIKRCNLNVPILIQAEEDAAGSMAIDRRRDAFCGKISVCNNLRQAGIDFTLTNSHTVKVASEEFKADLDEFAAVCRIVRGLRHVRFGAIGGRPAAFNTVRYSEKILEYAGIAVEPVDLYEILGRVDRLRDTDRGVKAKLNAIKKYTNVESIPAESLLKMAKFGRVVDQWVKENQLAGTAIQCWTALEEFFGIVPCTLMSMMSESLLPSACEVDVTGLLAMYILQLAGGAPSALLDGTTTSKAIRTNASCSIAAICRSLSSRPTRWTTRRSSPARSARTTPTVRSSVASRPPRSRSAGHRPTTWTACCALTWARAGSPTTSSRPLAGTAS